MLALVDVHRVLDASRLLPSLTRAEKQIASARKMKGLTGEWPHTQHVPLASPQEFSLAMCDYSDPPSPPKRAEPWRA